MDKKSGITIKCETEGFDEATALNELIGMGLIKESDTE